MNAPDRLPRLGPAMLHRLPSTVGRPAYDRTALRPRIAHLGVGAFHRVHQAEYTDDLLAGGGGAWGIVGVNLRAPRLAEGLGRQDGLYTRLIRDGADSEARIIGSILGVIDSQDDCEPALRVLASPETDIVTLTVTEKGYCHVPATGDLDRTGADIVHDLEHAASPRSLPGLLACALERRRATHGRPLTLMSCDNIPANGAVLERVVSALAAARGDGLADWIASNAAFPSTMVDRIAPATTDADRAEVESRFGYRDGAVAVGEPFRQWVIEDRFAGPRPPWEAVGATLVETVTPHEHIKMRLLNGAQTTLACLGVLAGHEHTLDAVADPLLAAFVRRMLLDETVPTLQPVPGMEPVAYVALSFERLRNPAIRHRCHQIATDGSQKIVQRLLAPIRERACRGQASPLLTLAVAGCMVYLLRASRRFGAAWSAEDPFAGRVAAIADRIGRDPDGLAGALLALDAIFPAELAANAGFRFSIAAGIAGLLDEEPLKEVRRRLDAPADAGWTSSADPGMVRAVGGYR